MSPPIAHSTARELAELVHQFLGHQVETSCQLSNGSKESLTVANECIEQAYQLQKRPPPSDRLLRIYESHIAAMASATSHCESSSAEPTAGSTTTTTTTATSTHPNQPTNKANTLADLESQLLQQHQQQQQQHQLPQPPVPPATKQHSQHPISQLPMTTRKKLSHLRAQIKRQASKAARSRLEKRTSISGSTAGGAGSSSQQPGQGLSQGPTSGHQQYQMMGHMGSVDMYNGSAGGAGAHKQSHQDYPYSSKDATNTSATSNNNHNSSLDSPYSGSPTIVKQAMSSSQGFQSGQGTCSVGVNVAGSDQTDCQIANSSLPSNQHHHQGEASGSSSSAGHKLSQLIPGTHHHNQQQHSIGVSVHQKNFKQKLIALIKKFRTDGSDFDSEEQYREALERELIKATAGRGSRAIEELFEEDIDVDGESGSGPDDWDNISESSTPKPSLRPFFSSTTLDKI